MGAGNPKLKSFDNDRFEPTTYFLDLGEDFDKVQQSLESENGEEPSEDEVWREVGYIEEMNFEDLIESISSELKHSKWKINSGDNLHPELSYAFRDEGIILTEGKRCYVITETGAEYNHLPIAVIPNFKFETFYEDALYSIEDKRSWYEARGKSLEEAAEKIAEREWEKELKEFKKEAETVLKTIHGWYNKSMSQRSGPWMSGPVDSTSIAA